MAVTRQKKEEIKQEIAEKMKKASSVILSQYQGLSVSDLTTLRRKLREGNVEFKVAKKTIVKIAAQENNIPELPSDIMEGQIGLAIGYDDEVSAAKLLYGFSKEFQQLKITGGFMDGKILSGAEALELAKIPSRDELLGKFVGMIRSPLYSFHGIIGTPLSSFARAMSSYADQKEEDAEEKSE